MKFQEKKKAKWYGKLLLFVKHFTPIILSKGCIFFFLLPMKQA